MHLLLQQQHNVHAQRYPTPSEGTTTITLGKRSRQQQDDDDDNNNNHINNKDKEITPTTPHKKLKPLAFPVPTVQFNNINLNLNNNNNINKPSVVSFLKREEPPTVPAAKIEEDAGDDDLTCTEDLSDMFAAVRPNARPPGQAGIQKFEVPFENPPMQQIQHTDQSAFAKFGTTLRGNPFGQPQQQLNHQDFASIFSPQQSSSSSATVFADRDRPSTNISLSRCTSTVPSPVPFRSESPMVIMDPKARRNNFLAAATEVIPNRERHFDLLKEREVAGARAAKHELFLSIKEWKILQDIELKNRPKPNYMIQHNELSPHARMLLCNWILSLASKAVYSRKTYHLAVALLDFYLSDESDLQIEDFQILGSMVLAFAAKNEEQETSIEQFLIFLKDGYDDNPAVGEDMLMKGIEKAHSMEKKLMTKMKNGETWSLPTPYDWLEIYFQNCALVHPQFRIPRKNHGSTLLGSVGTSGVAGSGKNGGPMMDGEFLERRFDDKKFLEAASLLARLVLDYGSLRFQNSLLAAGVFSLTCHLDNDRLEIVTGFTKYQLSEVYDYILDFERTWNAYSNMSPSPDMDLEETESFVAPDDYFLQGAISLSIDNIVQLWESQYVTETIGDPDGDGDGDGDEYEDHDQDDENQPDDGDDDVGPSPAGNMMAESIGGHYYDHHRGHAQDDENDDYHR
ncbi:G1/S-specific cyclin-E1 [Blyttiomyces sp. JEL0837]|nr:G1/S-specific cyclin-E1 [Blyttiomyces sp. JEL0837]